MRDQAEQLRANALAGNDPGRVLNRRPGSHSRIIAVSSGKGGVGKTSLVVNLGLVLAQLNHRIVVIDADLGLANVEVLLNLPPGGTLYDVINGTKRVQDILLEGPLNLQVAPGGSGLYDLANLDQVRRRVLLEQLTTLEEAADIILIDTAAGISRNVISFIGAAGELLLVTTPEPTAMTDAYGMLKVLAEKQFNTKCRLVVNFTRNLKQGRTTYEKLQRVAGKYLPGMELSYLGEIGYDQAVAAAVRDYRPFVIGSPRSAASAAVQRIAWRIVGGETGKGPGRGLSGLVNRLRELPCG